VANTNLSQAKRAKNDEFYTQFPFIQNEMNAYLERDPEVFADKTVLLPCDDPEWSNFTKFFAQNFTRLGLKKLISTSYAPARQHAKIDEQLSLFDEEADPKFDPAKTTANGKIFTLTRDTNGDGRINFDDLEWDYLDGDGDFRSDEVCALRDEADVIITNPPFSLFREFLAWVGPTEKQFVVIGNMNAIAYKEVFPLIKNDQMWLGATANGSDMVFAVPAGTDVRAADKDKARKLGYDGNYTRLGNACWFTNIDHGRRHQPIPLMTQADNIKFSTNKAVKGVGYARYDNYDAIEVPVVKAIPSDYTGVMGVPITFLDKYSPEQFEIVGCSANGVVPDEFKRPHFKKHNNPFVGGIPIYQRILIRHRGQSE
jgi:hypothetical protein